MTWKLTLLLIIIGISIVGGMIYMEQRQIIDVFPEILEGRLSFLGEEFFEDCSGGNIGSQWAVGGWAEGSGGDGGWCWITQTGGSDNMTSIAIDLSAGDINYANITFDTDHVSFDGDGDVFRVWANSSTDGWTLVLESTDDSVLSFEFNLSLLIDVDDNTRIIGECITDDKNDDCRWDNINVSSHSGILPNSPPDWSLNSTNNTDVNARAGRFVEHRTYWVDSDSEMSGYIFTFDNGTGTLANDSWVAMDSSNWTNITKGINASDATLQWRIWVNDSEGEFNATNIYTYDSVVGIPWNISTALYVRNISINVDEGAPSGIFFNATGGKMYIIGSTGDEINEYNLTTNWDISTATQYQAFDISGDDGSPRGIYIRADGEKVYTVGGTDITINEYNMTTPWFVNSLVYHQDFDTSGETSILTGVFFNATGEKMYVTGYVNVTEYNLTSAWDVSTAVYYQVYDLSSEETAPQGKFMKPEGDKFYIVGDIGKGVDEYDLSNAWSITSGSHVQFLDTSSRETGPRGIFFNSSGTSMYVAGSTNDRVVEFELGDPISAPPPSECGASVITGGIYVPTGCTYYIPDSAYIT